jgi:TRAP-type C4-dicarboxylate transport system permease small subunit
MLMSLRRLALACALAGCGAACLVALLTVASVVGRSLWSRPIPGDVELSQFGIALCIALCLPWCQLHHGNIIVDFFTQRAGPRTLRLLDAFGSLLLALMVGLLAWRSAAAALAVHEAQETTMILGLPMWISYAALAPGLALTALIALLQAFSSATEGRT